MSLPFFVALVALFAEPNEDVAPWTFAGSIGDKDLTHRPGFVHINFITLGGFNLTITQKFSRLSLIVSASAFAAVAIVQATVIIPAVKSDTFALAAPDRAAIAFWVNSLLFLAIAVVLFLLSRRVAESGLKGGLIGLGILALVLALALFDAAIAFKAHGPSMQTADTMLFVCATLGLLASILLITTAFFRRDTVKSQKDQLAS
jgi:hypothetical protein